MKKTALLTLLSIAIASPSLAKSHHHHHHHHHHVYRTASHHRVAAGKTASSHTHITCEMVRAYVAQVGLVQARAMALSAGMSAAEERRARRCLASGA